MKFLLLFILLGSFYTSAESYIANIKCKECHETIYEEYRRSMHAKSYFSDELHRKVADSVDTKRYACATCHMPSANNIEALITGKERPDKRNTTHTDGVSCYFCHTIAYVKKSHRFNLNVKAKQAENYKPTFFGRLERPDESDKHSSLSNPIYAKQVCTGCHSHKRNEHNITVFHAMKEGQESLSCIECHMPKVPGGVEKMDKRVRGEHASHEFPGIHDKAFRMKGVDIDLAVEKNRLKVTLTNKMPHPLIIQPARAKFLKIEVVRKGKIVWKNFETSPSEDRQGYFAYRFERNGKEVVIPATATQSYVHNLDADETKVLSYDIPKLQKGDTIRVGLYVRLAKEDCAKVVKLDDKRLTKPELIKQKILKWR